MWGNKRRGVGRGRSTTEVREDAGNARRVDGGKDRGQGKICCGKRLLDTERARDAQLLAADRRASKTETNREVDHLADPCPGAAIDGGVSTSASRCSGRGG